MGTNIVRAHLIKMETHVKNTAHKIASGIKRHWKKVLVALLCLAVAHPVLILPSATVIIYESVFAAQPQTPDWMQFSTEEFPGLCVEREDFQSRNRVLAGYRYSKAGQRAKGILVLAHGMGSDGHNSYMPLIDAITSAGYYVFTYDAHGTDNSGGGSVVGLPQGVMDLDNAICHVKTLDMYHDLPIMLLGHSWGGYSVGTVLGMHSDIQAAVIVAGFNESEDLLRYQGETVSHTDMTLVMPYLRLYERIKFGSEYADTSAIQSMQNSEATVMVIHSRDDETVPFTYGYDKFYSVFGSLERFVFVPYDNRGHSYLFYSDAAQDYRATLNQNYADYLKEHKQPDLTAVRDEFMDQYMDKQRYFELDADLMGRIIAMFDRHTINDTGDN